MTFLWNRRLRPLAPKPSPRPVVLAYPIPYPVYELSGAALNLLAPRWGESDTNNSCAKGEEFQPKPSIANRAPNPDALAIISQKSCPLLPTFPPSLLVPSTCGLLNSLAPLFATLILCFQ